MHGTYLSLRNRGELGTGDTIFIVAVFISRVWLLVAPWASAYQAPSSMGFSSQEYWSGLPLPSVLHGSGIAWFLIMCLALEWRELCLIQVGNKNVHDILDTNRCSMHIFCCCWVASVVSDSVRPHRRQPTRLPRPWDSPGKNTGVGCHFLLQCMKVKS